MISNLKERPYLFDKTITLIEKSFGYLETESYKVDFYPLIEEKNGHHNFIWEENGKVLGHVGIKLRQLGNLERSLKVCLIGGVAVAENYRGKGISKNLFHHIFKIFQQKVGLFVLWGNSLGYYKKFDFQPAGIIFESKGKNNPNFVHNYRKTKFKDLHPNEFDQIKKIYQEFSLKNFFSILRSNNDWDSIKKIETVDLYILKIPSEKIVGYFCQNKGMDLKGIVHEFGYLNEYSSESKNLMEQLKTWSPTSEQNVLIEKIHYQALFRMGNPILINSFIKELKILSWNKSEVLVSNGKNILPFSPESFFQYIFGPYSQGDTIQINYPLFISGLDSI